MKEYKPKHCPPHTKSNKGKRGGCNGEREAEKGREGKRRGAYRAEGGRREWDIGITEQINRYFQYKGSKQNTFFFTDFPVIEEQVRRMKYPVMIFS